MAYLNSEELLLSLKAKAERAEAEELASRKAIGEAVRAEEKRLKEERRNQDNRTLAEVKEDERHWGW